MQQQQSQQEQSQFPLKTFKILYEISKQDKLDQMKQILIQEKLLVLCLQYPTEQYPFEIDKELTELIQKINDFAMKQQSEQNKLLHAKQIARAVDMLFHKNIQIIFQKNNNELQRLRILTFSNLSYIYRDINRYADALKAVNYAINQEEKLAEKNYGSSLKDIITSLLNRSAILSELNRHDKSVQSVEKALYYIKIWEQNGLQKEQEIQLQYLYMISYFNLANEHETLNQIEKAIEFYEQTNKWAVKLNQHDMIQKVKNILQTLNKKK